MKFEKLVPSAFYTNLDDCLELFVDCLEFNIVHDGSKDASPFLVIEKDGLSMMIYQSKELAEEHYPEFRLTTKDIQAVYQKVSTTHPELLHPNLKKVTLRPWGAKEFAVGDKQVGFRIQEW